jgi:hypothetical protein
MLLFPAEYITNGIESYLDKQTTISQKINGCLLIIILLGLCFLPFVYVDVSVQDFGFLRPMAEKTELKSSITEFVDSVYVKEGAKLKQGDTILTFRRAQPEMKINYRKKRMEDIQEHLNDLQTISKGITPVRFSSDVRRQEYRLYSEELKKYDTFFLKAEKDRERNRILFDKNIISTEEYEGYYFESERIRNERNTFHDGQLSKWKTDYNLYRNNYEELLLASGQDDEEKELYTVTSPVTGTLDYFRGIYTGSLINAGSVLAVVSPDSLIYAEIRVSPQNIANIYEGMPAHIQIDSFNYLEWGSISGKVNEISSDFLIDPANNSIYYNVKCELSSNYLLRKDGTKGNLKKGMPVTSHFMITKRSIFDFIRQSLDEWINPNQSNKNISMK